MRINDLAAAINAAATEATAISAVLAGRRYNNAAARAAADAACELAADLATAAETANRAATAIINAGADIVPAAVLPAAADNDAEFRAELAAAAAADLAARQSEIHAGAANYAAKAAAKRAAADNAQPDNRPQYVIDRDNYNAKFNDIAARAATAATAAARINCAIEFIELSLDNANRDIDRANQSILKTGISTAAQLSALYESQRFADIVYKRLTTARRRAAANPKAYIWDIAGAMGDGCENCGRAINPGDFVQITNRGHHYCGDNCRRANPEF